MELHSIAMVDVSHKVIVEVDGLLVILHSNYLIMTVDPLDVKSSDVGGGEAVDVITQSAVPFSVSST